MSTNKNKYRKSLLIVSVAFLLCSLSYMSFVLIREVSHQVALQRLNERLEIHPSWGAVRRYILSKLKKGMPRKEVLQEFDKISPYLIKARTKNGCEIVDFKPGILSITSFALVLCYDSDSAQSLRYVAEHDF